ncbi:membrane bound O-acyl transferase family-domain-containing protein [Aspergillus floccosus]
MEWHPILLLITQVILSAFVTGFTPPNLVARPGAFIIVSLCTWQIISKSLLYLGRTPWPTIVSGYAVQLFFHYIDVDLIGQWHYSGIKDQQTVYSTTVITTFREWTKRLFFGLSMAFTCRFIGTPEQLNNQPPFFSWMPRYVPSRGVFLSMTALTVIACYIGIDLIQANVTSVIGAEYVALETIPFLRRLPEISLGDIITRAIISISTLISMICTQAALYNIYWLPFYGAPYQAYTMRRYWSQAWHQSNTHKFKTISHYIAHDLLHLPGGTLKARYAKNVIVFLAGLMHIALDMAADIPVYQSGGLAFFCGQMVGIPLEDLVIRVYLRVTETIGRRLPWMVERLVGYTWVVALLVWSSPAYLYPKIVKSRGLSNNDSVLPVSFFGNCSPWKWVKDWQH